MKRNYIIYISCIGYRSLSLLSSLLPSFANRWLRCVVRSTWVQGLWLCTTLVSCRNEQALSAEVMIPSQYHLLHHDKLFASSCDRVTQTWDETDRLLLSSFFAGSD